MRPSGLLTATILPPLLRSAWGKPRRLGSFRSLRPQTLSRQSSFTRLCLQWFTLLRLWFTSLLTLLQAVPLHFSRMRKNRRPSSFLRRRSWDFRLAWMFPAVLFLLPSCVKDNTGKRPGATETEVVFTLTLPDEGPESRALTTADESELRSIEILVFDQATQQHLYTVYNNTVTTTGTYARRFTVRLREGGPVDIMILANCRSWLTQYYPATVPVGELKSVIEEKLVVENSGKWNSTLSDPDYKPIPMWGQVEGVTVNAALASTGISGVKMSKMLARVDVSMLSAAQANFRLKTIRVYNYNTRAQIVPEYGDPLVWDASTGYALAPSLPANPGKADTPTPEANALLYDQMTTANIMSMGDIYLFEAAAGSAATHLENTCLVIGGEFSDDGFVTSETYYYRVDFEQTATPPSYYLPIKRNHRYIISVQEVKGSGFTDPDEAFRSVPVNIEATVTDWDLGGTVEIDPDGPRYLWLSSSAVEASAAAGVYQIEIETDNPSGWSAVASDSDTDPSAGLLGDWLTVTPAAGTTGTSTLTLSLTANNMAAPDRTGYIHLKAGNLTVVVTVTQEFKFDLGAFIPDEIKYGYVAAYWQAQHTGERLIRMLYDYNGNDITGSWTASVIEGEDWIVLDTDMSADNGIEWRGGSSPADMNTASNDNLYKVSGTATSVNGTCGSSSGDMIYFRIGLKAAYTPTAAEPARYGLVLLQYANHTKNTLVFVRQGLGDDYVMRPEDPTQNNALTPGSGGQYRPLAVKWSPFNLTSQQYLDGSKPGGNTNANHSQLAVYGGVPTQYPSQAGAIFQWANASSPRYAYHPVNPASGTITGHVSNTPASFWNTLKAAYETCPAGYRRPNDGSTIAGDASGLVADSETRQSLWLNPQPMNGNNRDNSLWGYCADGFFDRHNIVSSISGAVYSAVKPTDAKVGYIGNLVYNPYNCASLFFPALGGRATTGLAGGMGTSASYWTTLRAPALAAGNIGFDASGASTSVQYTPGVNPQDMGIGIRCVKE